MEDCFVRDLFFDLLADSMELDRLLGVLGVMGGSVDIAFSVYVVCTQQSEFGF
tara:strand:- start:30 stop:188 length:159 start_codon:yes stop_codon:yes gene_type:complete